VRPQRELVRLGCGADGVVRVGRDLPGRGAYVCADERCIERMLKPGRLAQAFRRPVAVRADLAQEVRESWQRQR
jgi:predicted RNA-binding protein YlxR (DUF448 family)